jgi:hypothetical protein
VNQKYTMKWLKPSEVRLPGRYITCIAGSDDWKIVTLKETCSYLNRLVQDFEDGIEMIPVNQWYHQTRFAGPIRIINPDDA